MLEPSMNFFDYTRFKLESYLENHGLSKFHATTLFKCAYRKSSVFDSEDLRNLPKQIFEHPLISNFSNHKFLNISQIAESKYDQSVKLLFELHDGQKIETVIMPEKTRITVCLSTQVGCAQGCIFCHTGRMGLKRNLKVSEIIGQILSAHAWMQENPDWYSRCRLPFGSTIRNVVFMGMGEPLDNVENLTEAISIMCDPLGLGIGLRHVSVSTAGHLEGLKSLMLQMPEVRIALSLHNPVREERSRLMPINRKWPVEDLISFLKTTRNEVLVQYTVISGVNDSDHHAKKLSEILSGLICKINLIPLNEIAPMRLMAPSSDDLSLFRQKLANYGHRVMVRYSKGQDIAAACGQLVTN